MEGLYVFQGIAHELLPTGEKLVPASYDGKLFDVLKTDLGFFDHIAYSDIVPFSMDEVWH